MFKRKKNKTGIERERLALSLYEKESTETQVEVSESIDDAEIAERLTSTQIKNQEKEKSKKKKKEKIISENKETNSIPEISHEDDKREEIFSTASKKVRLTTQNPLDEETDEEKQQSNTRELFEILDFLDKVQNNEQESSAQSETNVENLKNSDSEVPVLETIPELERIREISRQLNEEQAGRQRAKHDGEEERTITAPPRTKKDEDKVVTAGSPAIIDKKEETPSEIEEEVIEEIPVVSISVGKFSQVVRSQYEEYIKFNKQKAEKQQESQHNQDEDEDDEPIFSHRIKPEKKKKKPLQLPKKIGVVSVKKKANRTYFSDFEEFTEKTDKKRFYRGLAQKTNSHFGRTVFLAVLTIISMVLFSFEKFNPNLITIAGDKTPLLFCIINLVIIILSGIVCADTLVSGFKGIIRDKGNCDTGISFAYVGVLAQGLIAMFRSEMFFNGGIELYSALLVIILLLNTFGKYNMYDAARSNFTYLVSPKRKYAVKKYDDKFLKAKMLSGVSSDKNSLLYQKKTGFLNSVFYNQFRANRGQLFMNRLSLPLCVLSLLIALLYGTLLDGGLYGAISAFAVMCIACVPMSGFAVVQLFVNKVCLATRKLGAMIAGYGAYKSVASCGAVTVDIRALYPRGALSLKGIKTFGGKRVDEAIMNAAAIATSAGGPIADVFTGIVKGNVRLPIADSVIYEDEKGMIGWVNGERVLVGSAELLNEHGIETPSKDYESKFTADGSCITYVANAGILEAMFIIKYRPEIKVAAALQALEDSRTAILVRTVDENITAEKIAKDFGLYHRSIKVLPTGLGNVMKQVSAEEDEKSESAISTGGNFVSLAHAVANSKRLGGCIRLIISLQLIALVLGVCLVTVLVLCAGIGRLGAVELAIYLLFWIITMFVGPLFLKN